MDFIDLTKYLCTHSGYIEEIIDFGNQKLIYAMHRSLDSELVSDFKSQKIT